MKKTISIFIRALAFAAVFISARTGFPADSNKATLGVYGVNAVAGIKKTESLDRVLQSMDSHLVSALGQTRKFVVVARSDWKSVMKEQDFSSSGNVDPGSAAKTGKALGAKYILETTITDFQDYVETARFETIDKTVQKRVLRFGAVAKFYDSTSGALMESSDFTITNNDVADLPSYSQRNGSLNDALVNDISRLMAKKIASHIADVAFPAKVVSVIGNQIIINRGESSDIAAGDVYKIMAQGEAMIDPDTGENLGNAEADVGSAVVTEVLPKFSKAKLLENFGVQNGAIARKALKKKPSDASK